MNDEMQIAVVGCGLAGTVLAMFLARAGQSVFVCDKNMDPRLRKPSRGRSINLTLTLRGLSAFKALGIESEVRAKAVPLTKRIIHSGGNTYESPYSSSGPELGALYSINRHTLHCLLLDILNERFKIVPHFSLSSRAQSIPDGVLAFTDRAGKSFSRKFETIFAADGVFSELRTALLTLVSASRNREAKQMLEKSESFHGNIELSISKDASWSGARDALHVWPANNCTLIGFPSYDGSVTCTLQIPQEGKYSQKILGTKDSIEAFMKATFPDVEPFLDCYAETLLSAKSMPMHGVKCALWTFDGKLCLLGDSAHAVFPSLGQGANCAFEDALLLDQLLRENSFDFATVFQRFECRRKPDADALHDMSVAHYELLRSPENLAADATWRKKRAALQRVCESVGDDYYESIAFSHESYAYVLERDRLLKKMLKDASADEFDEKTVSNINFALAKLRQKYPTKYVH